MATPEPLRFAEPVSAEAGDVVVLGGCSAVAAASGSRRVRRSHGKERSAHAFSDVALTVASHHNHEEKEHGFAGSEIGIRNVDRSKLNTDEVVVCVKGTTHQVVGKTSSGSDLYITVLPRLRTRLRDGDEITVGACTHSHH